MGNKSIDIVNIGNVIMDILIKVKDEDIDKLKMDKGIMHLVDEKRQEEIIEFFQQRQKELEMGGAGPNVLRTVALLGKKGALAGQVAKDVFGKEYIKRVEEIGIYNKIRMSDKGSTGTSIILVSEDGQRTMNTCLGNSRFYTELDVPVDEVKHADYLFITGYQWDTEGQIEAMEFALKTAKESNTKIAFDLADPFAVGRSKEAFRKVIQDYADIVFANEEEAKMMFSCEAEKALDELSKQCEIAIVKIGAEGSLIKSGDKTIHVKANKVDVLDTTGAGDIYAGGFMYGLISGFDIEKCGKIAGVCAEQVIQVIGAKLPNSIKEIVEAVN